MTLDAVLLQERYGGANGSQGREEEAEECETAKHESQLI